ncbi:peptidylprolyl isomerase [Paenibacillus provencensis]|uniref:Peptidyl-prolyl cis-trans isomerase n=1 Tax=Paenibacillus provencensis TaxID=441151 RepID=A0ABW3Q0D4_9BACL|nr:peptidylprolyl isomerase [Paenibacillus sp. MER 78]MCM3127789.1 peptidylprolyl isomerase [Paenibacillus sp. MER 78]
MLFRSKGFKFLFLLTALVVILTGCGKDTAENDELEFGGIGVPDPEKSHPVATLELSNGKQIVMELYPEIAPNTVNNFISLANSGFYDGTIFHRVIPNFMIQGGDPEGTGTGGPGYSIKGEFTSNGVKNHLLHVRGVVSMARSNDLDSAGSQFFIVQADSEHLDNLYAAFGKVTEGLDVVDEIANLERDQNDRPVDPPVMTKVTVDTLGVDYPEPEKIE